MRRTRHVMLPVRSWYYIGLMVVSLACLTLGLVSRDREGKSGNLTSPELKNTAPHEVDACPNPLGPSLNNDMGMRRINYERRVVERRAINPQIARTVLENQRLNRMHIGKTITRDNMRSRIDERRALSLDRHTSNNLHLREVRNERMRENRLSSEIKTRQIQRQDKLSTRLRQNRIVRENILYFQDRRATTSKERVRSNMERRIFHVQRENIRFDVRKLLDDDMERRERIVDNRRDNRRNNEHLSIERREIKPVKTFTAHLEQINDVDSSRRIIRVNSIENLTRREILFERRNSLINRQLSQFNDRINNQRYNNRHRNNYSIDKIEFPLIKSTIDSETRELLWKILIFALSTIYTASLFKRKTGFIRNILSEINRVRVW